MCLLMVGQGWPTSAMSRVDCGFPGNQMLLSIFLLRFGSLITCMSRCRKAARDCCLRVGPTLSSRALSRFTDCSSRSSHSWGSHRLLFEMAELNITPKRLLFEWTSGRALNATISLNVISYRLQKDMGSVRADSADGVCCTRHAVHADQRRSAPSLAERFARPAHRL